ncbi:hypothetical protein QBC34DRAFT_474761 [Podospora aff. communis PSN243]|uniref:Uncharacterized protein n=1 Tax=Podospora aff. communis PSN243 TaxID=3040156 RepID=A0AAV9G9M1_9PEZI|nr:hypothetical protein QBC34DRAFT_474761 [Podospora aff. communis PSN243]
MAFTSLKGAFLGALAGFAAFPAADAAVNLAIRRDAITVMSTVHEIDTVTAWASSSSTESSTSAADTESRSSSTITVIDPSGTITSSIVVPSSKEVKATLSTPTRRDPASVITCDCKTKTVSQLSWSTVTSFVTITPNCDTTSTPQSDAMSSLPFLPSTPPIEIHPSVTPFLPPDGGSTSPAPTTSSSEEPSTTTSDTNSLAASSSIGEIPTRSTFLTMTNNTTSTSSKETSPPSTFSATTTSTADNSDASSSIPPLPFSPPLVSSSTSVSSNAPTSPDRRQRRETRNRTTEAPAPPSAPTSSVCFTPPGSDGRPETELAVCGNPIASSSGADVESTPINTSEDHQTTSTSVGPSTTAPPKSVEINGTRYPLGPGHEVHMSVSDDM